LGGKDKDIHAKKKGVCFSPKAQGDPDGEKEEKPYPWGKGLTEVPFGK